MREIKLRKDRGSPVPPNPLELGGGGNEVPFDFRWIQEWWVVSFTPPLTAGPFFSS